MKYVTGAIAALLVLGVTGCADEDLVTEDLVVRPVKVFTVGSPLENAVLELPGSVHAMREAELAFEVPGRVVSIFVQEGDTVDSGDDLVRLDSRDYDAALVSAVAQRDAAEADYSRYVEASSANAVTRQALDLAKRNLEVAEAGLISARKAVEDTVLRAPFAGRVAKKFISEYENVQAKQIVFELHDESRLEVHVSVSERDWATLPPDNVSAEEIKDLLNPQVEITALPGRWFEAIPDSFSTSVDPLTRTYKATFAFDAPAEVSPGMTAKLSVRNLRQDTQGNLFIPPDSVFASTSGESLVWVIDESGRVIRAGIQVGELVGGQLEVLSGLKAGTNVAVSGIHTLEEGMVVRPLEEY